MSLAQAVEELRSLKRELTGPRGQTDLRSRVERDAAPLSPSPAPTEPAVLAKIEELRQTVLRQAADAREQTEALETASREATQARNWLGEVIAQLEVGQQATKQRLDAQADVIRGLHAAAQEQKARGEELRAAVRQLEEIVARLGQGGPVR